MLVVIPLGRGVFSPGTSEPYAKHLFKVHEPVSWEPLNPFKIVDDLSESWPLINLKCQVMDWMVVRGLL